MSTEVPAAVGGPVALTLHDEPTATREYLQSRLGAADLAIWLPLQARYDLEKAKPVVRAYRPLVD